MQETEKRIEDGGKKTPPPPPPPHLESYISTLTVLICSAPPQASAVQIVYDKLSALFTTMLEGDSASKTTALRAYKTLLLSSQESVRTKYIRSVSHPLFKLFFAYKNTPPAADEDIAIMAEIISIQRLMLSYCIPGTHLHMLR